MGELISMFGLGALGPAIILILIFLVNAVRRLLEYERGVVFRLGRLMPAPRGPGITFVIPLIEQVVKVDMRTITMDIPPQDVITRDNISLKVNAVLYMRVGDPVKVRSPPGGLVIRR